MPYGYLNRVRWSSMRFFTRRSGQQVVLELNGEIIAVVEASEHQAGGGLRIGVVAAPQLIAVPAETLDVSRLKRVRNEWRDLHRLKSKRA